MRPKIEAQYACMRACYVRVHVGVRMGLGPCPLWLPFGLVLLASLLNIYTLTVLFKWQSSRMHVCDGCGSFSGLIHGRKSLPYMYMYSYALPCTSGLIPRERTRTELLVAPTVLRAFGTINIDLTFPERYTEVLDVHIVFWGAESLRGFR